MWTYVLIFSICIFGLLINNLLKPNQKKYIEIPTLLFLLLVSGTRFYLGGSDYYIYKSVYESLPTIKEFIENYFQIHDIYITFGFENGYLFLNSIIKSLGFNYFGFTLLHSTFFYLSMYLGLKKYTYNLNLLVIVFLYKLFFYNTFISMRQSITLGIFFLALKYIDREEPLKYFLIAGIATTIHNGALILIPLYFINKIVLNKNKIIILNLLFIPTLFLSYFNVPIMRIFDFIINIFDNPVSISKATKFISSAPTQSLSILHTIEYFLIMSLVIVFYNEIVSTNKYAKFFIKIFLLLLPIFTLLRNYIILTRIIDYFIISYGIILNYLCLVKNGKYKLGVQIITICLCFIGFIRFVILFDNGGLIPYKSILFNNTGIFN